MTTSEVGRRLRMLREGKGLTQKEAAEALGMPRTTYVHYEDGSNEPKISVLIKFSAFYGISVDWIIGWDAEQSESPPPDEKWEALRKILELLSDDELKEVHSFVKFQLWEHRQEEHG